MVTFAKMYPFVAEFTVKEATVSRVTIFLKEALHKINFLGIYKMFNIINSSHSSHLDG